MKYQVSPRNSQILKQMDNSLYCQKPVSVVHFSYAQSLGI